MTSQKMLELYQNMLKCYENKKYLRRDCQEISGTLGSIETEKPLLMKVS